jgi:hypothetical protein
MSFGKAYAVTMRVKPAATPLHPAPSDQIPASLYVEPIGFPSYSSVSENSI